MGRKRNPERDASLKRYLESDGEISIAELAKQAGVLEARIRKWKLEDKWDEALKNKPKKRGGQKGNRNAAGKTPAKRGNRNAVTHGAYARAGYEDIDKEEAEKIQNMEMLTVLQQMMDELKALCLRKAYLEKLLKEYETEKAGGFYTDKIVHMIVPKSPKERDTGIQQGTRDEEKETEIAGGEQFKTAMKSVIKSSPFERAMKVEAELNKIHGRIIKQLDSIKAYEIENRRLELIEKQMELKRQQLTGEFEIDPEIDEIEGETEESHGKE